MIDMDVVGTPAFVILAGMALGATALGYMMSIKMGWIPLPLWQLVVIMGGELVACYVIVARG
ncbi:hypothetical protein LCGC14_0979980 [marine sediment metagenome]|uniref:Uncharacterized protein n=1 Tax=marine sediment metagenome TaxID=412755 RepID=A0A0F9QSC9_9ZZZZ